MTAQQKREQVLFLREAVMLYRNPVMWIALEVRFVPVLGDRVN